MILNAEEAVEIGEALLNAAEAVKDTNKPQSVMVMGAKIVSVPDDGLTDEWEHIAYVTKA